MDTRGWRQTSKANFISRDLGAGCTLRHKTQSQKSPTKQKSRFKSQAQEKNLTSPTSWGLGPCSGTNKKSPKVSTLWLYTECFDFFFLTGRLGACAEARAQARRAEQESTFGPRGCRLLVGGPAQQATALPSKGPVWNQQIKLKLK